MSAPTLPPVNVPTLTEVVEWSPWDHPRESPQTESAGEPLLDLSDSALLMECPPQEDFVPAVISAADVIDESELTERILARVQQHVDLMLEQRLPPLMVSTMDRAVEELVAHTRRELALTLREIVATAVLDEALPGRGAVESLAPDGVA